MNSENIPYKRILLKISGKSLAGDQGFGISSSVLRYLSKQIQYCWDMGIQTGLVVGGGNFWRGTHYETQGMNRAIADYAGMLATVINALSIQDCLEKYNIPTRIQSAIPLNPVAEPYIMRRAIRHMEKNRLVVFASGTGNTYMSTDTAAALRALEVDSQILLMAKNNVDGVYDCDPTIYPNAKKYSHLTHQEALQLGLGVIDSTALSLCMTNKLPIIVFDIFNEKNLQSILCGQKIGTLITSSK